MVVVTNYGADGGCMDNDDGSSWYNLFNNYCVYGGHKSDFDGHSKRSFNNIHAYSNVYGSKCAGIMNLPHVSVNDFFAEGYRGNKCVLAEDAGYLDLGGGCTPDATLANRILLGNNSIYSPTGAVTVSCGKSYSFAEWAALGLDVGSSVHTLPDAPTIIGWARATLGMPPAA